MIKLGDAIESEIFTSVMITYKLLTQPVLGFMCKGHAIHFAPSHCVVGHYTTSIPRNYIKFCNAIGLHNEIVLG